MKPMKNFFVLLLFLSFNIQAQGNTPINVYIDKDVMSSSLIEESTINTEESSFHLFSHGKSGELLIEGQWRDAKQIVHWLKDNEMLQNQKQLNIYGCEFAKGEKGLAAVQYLEESLGLNISASNDVTGIDGDWELEVGGSFASLEINDYAYNLQSCNLIDNGGVMDNVNSDWVQDGTQTIGGNTFAYDLRSSGNFPGAPISDDIYAWDGQDDYFWFYDPNNLSGNPDGEFFMGTTGFLCIVNTRYSFEQCGADYDICIWISAETDFRIYIETTDSDTSQDVLTNFEDVLIPASGTQFDWQEFCFTVPASDIPADSENIIVSVRSLDNSMVYWDAMSVRPADGSACADFCPCVNPEMANAEAIAGCVNGTVELLDAAGSDAYHWSLGSIFDDAGGTLDYTNATSLTGATFPLEIANGQPNPSGSQTYTIRLYNGEDACFTDVVAVMQELPTRCSTITAN